MESGQKDNLTEEPGAGLKVVFGFGRFVGFALLAGPALLILAAMVLLPAYKSLSATQYALTCQQVDNDWYKKRIAANERLIKTSTGDEILTTRVLMEQRRVVPPNVIVVDDPKTTTSLPPGTVIPPPKVYPAKPTNAWLAIAEKVKDPATRRGLFLLSGLAMLAAMFLFAPPQKYKKTEVEN
ncbi:MAG: hypothetical protein EHM48_06355 [Planctomycetaceae bacterium]|nr:MAG: hypothetical protein EHM48_06355 [Planctomycetaceae bacterium]